MESSFEALARQAAEKHFRTHILFGINASLTADNTVVEGVFLVGETAVYLATPDADGQPLLRQTLLEKISGVILVKHTGSIAIEARVAGEDALLCRSLLQDWRNYEQAAKWLYQACDEHKPIEELRFVAQSGVCPKCHATLFGGVCYRCGDGRKVIGRMWQFVRPRRFRLFFGISLFFVTAALQVLIPKLNAVLIDSYLQSPDPASVTFWGLLGVVIAIALANLLGAGVGVLRNGVMARVSTETVTDIRHKLYYHVQKMSVSGVLKYSTGELLSRLAGDTEQIAGFLTGDLPAMLEQILTLIVVGAVMIGTEPLLALFVLLPVPFVLLMFRLIWRYTHRLYFQQWVANSEASTVLHDIFRGIRVVKVFGTEKREMAKYERAVRTVRDVSIRNEITWARVMPYANFVLGAGSFIVLYYVGNGILNHTMTLGQLTMFSGYVGLIYAPIRFMARLPRTLQRTATGISKVMEVIDDESVLREEPQVKDIALQGKICVENISFGYQAATPVLKNVSVEIRPGEMLGIVGRSGVGKSTLINLIMRLYDVDSGRITVDGHDIRSLSQRCLRSQMGVVLQENFLFTGTILENIAYARPDATLDQVIRAAKKASCHDFIMKLPDGYNSRVGENGYTLSGGERQRIAIARAILHDPKILILDEATASLDTETEKDIQDALAQLIRDRTTIAIAHRLSTLRNATKLLVLDKGTVAECGPHEELMKQKGIYYELVMAQRQMSKMEPEPGEK